MTELDTEHVKRNGAVWQRVLIGRKSKPRLRIDESPNEPGRGYAVNAGTWTCDPQPAVVGLRLGFC